MTRVLAWCGLAAALLGCATERATREFLLVVDGRTRRYLVHTPPDLDDLPGPHPAVLVLHGGGSVGNSNENMGRYTGFDAKADSERFIAVYPFAVEKNWNDGRNAQALPEQRDNVDDVGFFSALLDELIANHRVDPRRVYATGISNGGFMSHRLGCDLSARIAAIAPIAAGMPEPLSHNCAPTRAVPVMNFHGTEDGFVPFGGGPVRAPYTRQERGQTLSSDATRDTWARLNGCGSTQTHEALPDPARDRMTSEKISVDGCPAAGPVIQVVIHGGGHTWPGSRWLPYLGPVTADFHATDMIWEFFRDRALP